MKNWGIFLGGVGTGVVLTIVVLLFINLGVNRDPIGVVNFDQPGEALDQRSVRVLQVVTNTSALVSSYDWDDTIYLLRNHEGKYYYDDERIKLPSGIVFRQTGIYKYTTKMGDTKTVPVIEIMPDE